MPPPKKTLVLTAAEKAAALKKKQKEAAIEAATLGMKKWISRNVSGALQDIQGAAPGGDASKVQMIKWGQGKLFELYTFVLLLKRMHDIPGGCTIKIHRLIKGQYIYNGAPTSADPERSHVSIKFPGMKNRFTVWQSVEFVGLSGLHRGPQMLSGDYHEADVIVLDAPPPKKSDPKFRPIADDVALVIECKFMPSVSKQILRNMLGLRREMSYVGPDCASPFPTPNAMHLEAELPATRGEKRSKSSHLILAYGFKWNNPIQHNWQHPGTRFGIDFWQII